MSVANPGATPAANDGSVTSPDSVGTERTLPVAALDEAGADGDADEDETTKEFTALPGAHPDSRAQLQSRSAGRRRPSPRRARGGWPGRARPPGPGSAWRRRRPLT